MKHLVYEGKNGIKISYIFHKAQRPTDTLVVSFPGANGLIAGGEWGYMVTIQQMNVNALFIKTDRELNKSMLTYVNREPIIERTVKELVDKCLKESNSSRVIATGSSMGGFCAVYYGLQYDWDIISGTPPYTITNMKSVRFATGSATLTDKKWLNERIYSVVSEAGKRGYNKKFFVMWGEGEKNWTQEGRGKKLLADLDAAGIKYTYKLYQYSSHRTIHRLFPQVLKERICYYLGIADEPDENKQDLALNSEGNLYLELTDIYTSLLGVIDDNKESAANTAIVKCACYGSLNLSTALRNYVYLQQGWYWGHGYKNPSRLDYKGEFWRILPADEIGAGVSFWFQHALLNYYNRNGEDEMLDWCVENARQYLEYIYRIVDPKVNNKWWNACRRMHFFIDLHRAVSKKEISAGWFTKIPVEILRDLRFVLQAVIEISKSESQYRRVLALLHAAVYFKNNASFHDAAYNAAVEVLCKLTDYYFDENGVCVFMQIRHQSIVTQQLKFNLEFIQANKLPETKALTSLKRKFAAIVDCTAHITRPDGILPALGHSIYEKAVWTSAWVGRKTGNFIKHTSNLAILNDGDLAYLTVNGGSNSRSSWRHCDLLSFTFWYDGKQIFSDGGGGNDFLAEYARSAIAHNSFICDKFDYITPNYIDWTTIDSVDEQEHYVKLSMSHTLVKGVEMKRTLFWLKPNAIILFDEALSEAEHTFTQNMILENFPVNLKDKQRVIVYIAPEFTVMITQLPMGRKSGLFRRGRDASADFELTAYHGTQNIDDKQNLRGSLISSWQKLRNGLNLAYEKRGSSAQFLTIIEAHSPSDAAKEKEISVESAEIENCKLHVKLSNGQLIEIAI